VQAIVPAQRRAEKQSTRQARFSPTVGSAHLPAKISLAPSEMLAGREHALAGNRRFGSDDSHLFEKVDTFVVGGKDASASLLPDDAIEPGIVVIIIRGMPPSTSSRFEIECGHAARGPGEDQVADGQRAEHGK